MLTLFLSMLAYASALNSVTVANCDTNSVFTLKDISVTPTIPVVNENITLHTVYSVPAEVSEGVAIYSCSFNGIPFSPTVDDLCTQTTCPKTVGSHDEYSSVMVPQIGGKIICDMKWMDVDQSVSFLCLRYTLKLSARIRGKVCPMKATFQNSSFSSTALVPYETLRITQKNETMDWTQLYFNRF